jgi:EAL domain-containing protein (putative c-di-GMP-specific phosphodiesterase class I)
VTLLAEGIETRAQFERLRFLGCEFGQGYLFSPAVPVDEVEALLARGPADWG